MAPVKKRMQSPSSINTFKQCPRKYYYQYILKLKTLPNIHLVRGSVVHSVLEDFFTLNPDSLPEEGNFELLEGLLMDFLGKYWKDAEKELSTLPMTEAQKLFYYEETEQMIRQWLQGFLTKLGKEKMDFRAAFRKWIPKTEQTYSSEKHSVKGIIDAIHELEDTILLMDYKTSSKDHITAEYKLQLAIYCLLYEEKHGKLPDKVGINFLKFSERLLDVDEQLVKLAKLEVEIIHANTADDEMRFYPMNKTPLCKWSSGQCDFYDYCFAGKKIPSKPN